MIGRRFGPYEIVRPIGAGGMGAVFLGARADREFEKQVAIKLVLRGAESLEIVGRFRQERQTLASLDHPNIVRLLDGGSTDSGLPYLVMDYVEGQPILDYAQKRALTLRQRLRLFLQICDAVHYAHQHLVVHSDIKPANVLVTAEGQARLLDFGIARVLGRGAETGEPQSLSLRYASPEQIHAQPVTIATDVYALGLLLYELLTGSYPYPLAESSDVALAFAITQTARRRIPRWMRTWMRSSRLPCARTRAPATPRPSAWRRTFAASWPTNPSRPASPRPPTWRASSSTATAAS